MSTCKYFQVPVDPQVLENPWGFDPRLRVTRWLKLTRIQVWHFELEIPVGTDPGHPRVHSCSALHGGDDSDNGGSSNITTTSSWDRERQSEWPQWQQGQGWQQEQQQRPTTWPTTWPFPLFYLLLVVFIILLCILSVLMKMGFIQYCMNLILINQISK